MELSIVVPDMEKLVVVDVCAGGNDARYRRKIDS